MKYLEKMLEYMGIAAPQVKTEVMTFDGGIVTVVGTTSKASRQYVYALAHACTLHPSSKSVTVTRSGLIHTWEPKTGWKPTSSDDVADADGPSFTVTFDKGPSAEPFVFTPKVYLPKAIPPLTLESVPAVNGVPTVDPVRLIAVEHECDGEKVRWRTTADFLSYDGIRLLGSWGHYKKLIKTGFLFAHRGPNIKEPALGTGWDRPVDFFPMTSKMEAELYEAASKEGHGAKILSTPDWNTNGKYYLPWYQCMWSGIYPVEYGFIRAGHLKIWVASSTDRAANCGMYDSKGVRIQNEGYAHAIEGDSFLDYSQAVRGASRYVKVLAKNASEWEARDIRAQLRRDTHLGGPLEVPLYA